MDDLEQALRRAVEPRDTDPDHRLKAEILTGLGAQPESTDLANGPERILARLLTNPTH